MNNSSPLQDSPSRGYPQMLGDYNPPHQGHGASSSTIQQALVVQSHQDALATAPISRLPTLIPMPTGGVMPQNGISSLYAHNYLVPQQLFMSDSEQLTHVVDPQGHVRILPSIPGYSSAHTGAGVSKSTVPQKDADGKFPCPDCTKTYLHKKHLKRHMLRHTNDRPYTCTSCGDNFSRSDICKKHYQKCSIRQKETQPGELNQTNDLSSIRGNIVHSLGINPMLHNISYDQNQLSQPTIMETNGTGYHNDVRETAAFNNNPQLSSYNKGSN